MNDLPPRWSITRAELIAALHNRHPLFCQTTEDEADEIIASFGEPSECGVLADARELGYQAGRRDQLAEDIQTAVDHGAIYRSEPRPCDCPRSSCGVIVSPSHPFADLLKGFTKPLFKRTLKLFIYGLPHLFKLCGVFGLHTLEFNLKGSSNRFELFLVRFRKCPDCGGHCFRE